jgi:uncharacterized protein (TIGR00288 family)
MADQQIAVLIDYENVGLNAIQWLFDQISDMGRVTVRRAFADWSVAASQRDQLLELGIEPIHLFHSVKSGKNSSDIRLAIDAIELLYQSPVDTFVIVSSDSDFVPLVSKLRSAGKTVVGAGRQATVSRTLVTSCDRYFYLDQATRPTPSRPVRGRKTHDGLLARGMRAAMDEQGIALGSKLRERMQRLDPAFDFRALGYTTFSRYLEASPEVNVTRPRGPGDVTVELVEQAQDGQDGHRVAAGWAEAVDAAWSKKASAPGQSIPGTTAANEAAAALGVSKLGASQYKTLQGLIDASVVLRGNWDRQGNRIVRKAG